MEYIWVDELKRNSHLKNLCFFCHYFILCQWISFLHTLNSNRNEWKLIELWNSFRCSAISFMSYEVFLFLWIYWRSSRSFILPNFEEAIWNHKIVPCEVTVSLPLKKKYLILGNYPIWRFLSLNQQGLRTWLIFYLRKKKFNHHFMHRCKNDSVGQKVWRLCQKLAINLTY